MSTAVVQAPSGDRLLEARLLIRLPPSQHLLPPTLLFGDSVSVRAPAIHPAGRVIAFERNSGQRWTLGLLDSIGGSPRVLVLPFEARMPAWSPDGDSIAVVSMGRDSTDLILVVVSTLQHRRLVRVAGSILHPAWAPDGRTIAFTHGDAERFALRSLDLSSGRVAPMLERDARDLWPRWDAAGRRLVFFSRRETPMDDEVFILDSLAATPRRLTNRAGHDFVPALSPSGTLVAVVSATVDGPALRVIDLGGRETTRLSTAFHRITEPAWSPDERSIVFAASPRAGAPYALFRTRVAR